MSRYLKKVYLFLVFFFLYAPIIVLVVYSFNNSKSRGHWDGFTLKWYVELFRDREILKALYYTLAIAIISSIVSTLIGTAAAIGIHNMSRFSKGIVMNLTYLPVLSPDIVTGISLMILFIFMRLKLGFVSLLFAHITFNIPYVILSVLPKLKQLNKFLYEAALDLGATPLYAFKKVIFPEILPGIFTGFLLAFTLSIDDFVISFFTTGQGVTNLSITIFSMARRGINPAINALSTIMFAAVLILLIIINKRTALDYTKKEVKSI